VQARWMRFTSEMTFSMGFIAAAPGGERGVRWKVLEARGREARGRGRRSALLLRVSREVRGRLDEGSRETSLSWKLHRIGGVLCVNCRFYP
jgi:hypothetical protein